MEEETGLFYHWN